MKISVVIANPSGKKRRLEVPKEADVRLAQNKLGLSSQLFVVKLNGRIAHPKAKLKQGDSLEFIGVIYGG